MRLSLERISNLAHSYFVRSFQLLEFEYYTLYHGTRMALYFDEYREQDYFFGLPGAPAKSRHGCVWVRYSHHAGIR